MASDVSAARQERPGAGGSTTALKNTDQDRSYSMVMEGNSFFSNEELLKKAADEIRSFEQKGLRKSDIDDAAFRMRSAYLQAGFAFASVAYRYEKKADTIGVAFEINEGPRVRISSIDFTGNEHFPVKILSGFFTNTESEEVTGGGNFYVESALKDARDKIIDFYRSEGFTDVVVEKPALHFSDSREKVDITLNIAEGMRYTINDIVFSGDIIPDLDSELRGIKKTLLGKPYFARRKLLLWSRLKEAYDNIGFADSDIDVRKMYSKEAGKVILEASITSGKQIRISGVVVSGNDRTRSSFIRNRLQLQAGDIYSNEKKRESFRNLFDTGLFSKIEIGLSPPTENGARNLEVTVNELPSREVYLEPGWGSYENIRLHAGILDKNLFGTGRNGRVDGLISAKGETVILSFTDPWLLRTDIAVNVPLSYEKREEPSYTSKKTEISFLFSKNMSRSLTLSTAYSYSKTETFDLNDQEIVISGDDNYNKGTISTQAVWDTRDNIFYPTKGLRLAAGFDLSLPALGSDLDFGRFTFGCRYFIKLPKDFILGLRGTTGLIIPLPNQTFIPVGERFFNGGDNTVRSYKHSELGPKDDNGDPTGGLAYNVLSIELRRRFYRKFVASLYADAGNISPNTSLLERDFSPYDSRTELLEDTLKDFWGEFKFGVGFGLMYLLPVGPARIDIAYNPAPEKNWHEDSWVFHFSLGLAF